MPKMKVKKLKVKKKPPTKRRKAAVKAMPVLVSGNETIALYEGRKYIRPRKGSSVLYVTNTRINKTRTMTGLDYEVGLMGIYSRRDLRESIFKENDTHLNQYLLMSNEEVVKIRERVFELKYSFEAVNIK